MLLILCLSQRIANLLLQILSENMYTLSISFNISLACILSNFFSRIHIQHPNFSLAGNFYNLSISDFYFSFYFVRIKSLTNYKDLAGNNN